MSKKTSDQDQELELAPEAVEANKTAKEDKVPIHEKSLYGLGMSALGATGNVGEHQMQNILVFSLGMSPALQSSIQMIFRLWDAIIDPAMGWISDNTRTKWGRRRPYMFAGCILMAIIMPLVWRFSEDWGMPWIATYFTIFGILMSTAATIFNIPYQSLKMELTPDYDERTSVNIYSAIITKCFGMVYPWIWTLTQLPFFTGQVAGEEANPLYGIRNLAFWFAGLVLVLGMIPTFVCKERYYKKAIQQKKEPFFKNLKMTLKSGPFRMMVIFILLLNMEGLFTGFGGYISTFYVWGGDIKQAAIYGGMSGTASMFLGVLSLPVFGWLARRYSKERSLFLVVVAQIAIAASVPFCYNPNYPYLMLIPHVFNGIIMAGFWAIVGAIKADIVDDDELRTGERREGSYESVFSFILKLGMTLFMGISGFMVILIGFDIDLKADQADGVFRNMIITMSLIPLILSVIEAWIIWNWPLTKKRMGEIRAELEARRGAINS